MRKVLVRMSVLFLLGLSLTGCGAVGDKTGSLKYVYGAAAVLSFLLLLGCARVVRQKRLWFITLFSSVFVVNIGYTLLSVSTGLEMALWANRCSYLGSVFLPLSMLMIILNATNTAYRKRLPITLLGAAIIMFLITASPGILPIYYEEVSFAVDNGVASLVKVYGPLHPLYLVYLLGYFSAMVTVIIRAKIQKKIDTTVHALILAIAVFVNIGVWFIEQLVAIDFEMLSVSYIISELFLLGIHLVIKEYQRMAFLLRQVETAKRYSMKDTGSADAMLEKPVETDRIAPERIEVFVMGLQALTPSEKAIYDAYIARVTTKEIMANMNIKESTVKYHNRNLYSKLGVSGRKELLEIHKHIKSVKETLEDTADKQGDLSAAGR